MSDMQLGQFVATVWMSTDALYVTCIGTPSGLGGVAVVLVVVVVVVIVVLFGLKRAAPPCRSEIRYLQRGE